MSVFITLPNLTKDFTRRTMSKIKLQVPVKIDGVEFEAGTYDASDIPAGNLESLFAAKWAKRLDSSKEDDDEDESPKPPVAPKPRRK
jgi:hypothetical protein